MKEYNVVNPFLLWSIVTGLFYTSLIIIDYRETRPDTPTPTPIEYREFK